MHSRADLIEKDFETDVLICGFCAAMALAAVRAQAPDPNLVTLVSKRL